MEYKSSNHNRVYLGALIVLVGGILLLDQLNMVYIPDWLYNWPTILILIGIYSGIKHNFSNFGWLVWIFIGGIFLADDALPGMRIDEIAWPVGLILLGGYLIAKKSFQRRI